MRSTSRRRFLAGSSLLAAGLLGSAALPGRSLGFSVEPADSETAGLYRAACLTPAAEQELHDRLVAEVLDRLGDRVSREEASAALAALTCPSCGCRLG